MRFPVKTAVDSHSYLFKGFNYIEPNIIRSMSTLDMGALFSTIIASVFFVFSIRVLFSSYVEIFWRLEFILRIAVWRVGLK